MTDAEITSVTLPVTSFHQKILEHSKKMLAMSTEVLHDTGAYVLELSEQETDEERAFNLGFCGGMMQELSRRLPDLVALANNVA